MVINILTTPNGSRVPIQTSQFFYSYIRSNNDDNDNNDNSIWLLLTVPVYNEVGNSTYSPRVSGI